jgi:hypothetical protein
VALSKLIDNHRRFQNTEWALKNDALKSLEEINDKLGSEDIKLFYKGLFSQQRKLDGILTCLLNKQISTKKNLFIIFTTLNNFTIAFRNISSPAGFVSTRSNGRTYATMGGIEQVN